MLNIQESVPLAQYATFRIGGPAKFFAEVASEEDLREALQYAKENSLKFFVLGGGSNVLVSDQGFDGLVVKMKIDNFKIDTENNKMEVGVGASLAKVVKGSIENNLSGLEWATGIPGTLGGAVRGNAGAFGETISDAIESVRTINSSGDPDTKDYRGAECGFAYRDSVFKHDPDLIILSAVLKLRKGNREESQKKSREILDKRLSKQPKGMASAGSFFMNPAVKDAQLIKEFEKEMGVQSKDSKVPAGWLIDMADLRGKKIGGAMISKEHANFIVNTGQATAEDVIMLASYIKQQVRDKFGVQLQEEVQLVGF